MQRLRQQEASDKDFAPDTKDAPRALVLTPTAELCQQVLSVARGLARAAPVRSCAITGACSTAKRLPPLTCCARHGRTWDGLLLWEESCVLPCKVPDGCWLTESSSKASSAVCGWAIASTLSFHPLSLLEPPASRASEQFLL